MVNELKKKYFLKQVIQVKKAYSIVIPPNVTGNYI